jgi:hypothetical protein
VDVGSLDTYRLENAWTIVLVDGHFSAALSDLTDCPGNKASTFSYSAGYWLFICSALIMPPALEPSCILFEGIFLAFQYPVEIPGVSNIYLLKAALNAMRIHQGLRTQLYPFSSNSKASSGPPVLTILPSAKTCTISGLIYS